MFTRLCLTTKPGMQGRHVIQILLTEKERRKRICIYSTNTWPHIFNYNYTQAASQATTRQEYS